MVLASEFSDSSDDSDGNDDDEGSGTQQEPPLLPTISAVSETMIEARSVISSSKSSRPSSLFFSLKSRPQQTQQRQPSASSTATAELLSGGVASGGNGDGVGHTSAPNGAVTAMAQVGWMIDRGSSSSTPLPQGSVERRDGNGGAAASHDGELFRGVAVGGENVSRRTSGKGMEEKGACAEEAGPSVDAKAIESSRCIIEVVERRAATPPEGEFGREAAGDKCDYNPPGADFDKASGVSLGKEQATESPRLHFSSSGSLCALEASRASEKMFQTKKREKETRQTTRIRKIPPVSLPVELAGSGGGGRLAGVSNSAGQEAEKVSGGFTNIIAGGNSAEKTEAEEVYTTNLTTKKSALLHEGGGGSLEAEPKSCHDAAQCDGVNGPGGVQLPAPLPMVVVLQSEIEVKGVGAEETLSSPLKPHPAVKRASAPKRADPGGATNKPNGGVAGAKRSLPGEGRKETKKRKKKKSQKAGAKISSGGQGGGKNAIDDIFGSLF